MFHFVVLCIKKAISILYIYNCNFYLLSITQLWMSDCLYPAHVKTTWCGNSLQGKFIDGWNKKMEKNVDISLWAVVNLNSNRTCPVCTGLPDRGVYRPDPMVQYVALNRLTYDRGQFSWHSPVGGLTMTTPMARSDFLQYPA